MDWLNGTSIRLSWPHCHAYSFLLGTFVSGISDRHDSMTNRLTQLTHRLHEWQTRRASDTTPVTPPARCLSRCLRRANWKHTALPPSYHVPVPTARPSHNWFNSPSLSHSFLWVQTQPKVHPHRSRAVDNGACCWLIFGFKLRGRLMCSRYHLGQHVLRYRSHGALRSIL